MWPGFGLIRSVDLGIHFGSWSLAKWQTDKLFDATPAAATWTSTCPHSHCLFLPSPAFKWSPTLSHMWTRDNGLRHFIFQCVLVKLRISQDWKAFRIPVAGSEEDVLFRRPPRGLTNPVMFTAANSGTS